MVGFDLDQLESIKEMPTIAEKVSSTLPLVYLLMIFKDKRKVAIVIDEEGLYAITAALKIAGIDCINTGTRIGLRAWTMPTNSLLLFLSGF